MTTEAPMTEAAPWPSTPIPEETPPIAQGYSIMLGPIGDDQDKIEELLMLQERCTDDFDRRAIGGMLEMLYNGNPDLR